jgi:hypothetical protein
LNSSERFDSAGGRVTDIVAKDKALDPRLNWAALSQERDAAYDNNAAVKIAPR